ncbi:radial spoke head protein 3 homolog [Rhagoletis pomonella]|uniref:radial spoke head protein 3 homolog n=1 Tax=Rhagoletis pomonella TaxID=28610 RepID=UPI0017872596|nr:radial spoke head protein 3 homolog [Rhagoletis pomonella]
MKFDTQPNATNPEHLPPNSPKAEIHPTPNAETNNENNNILVTDTGNETPATLAESDLKNSSSIVRNQNFSFASTYRPQPHVSSLNSRFGSPQPINTSLYPHKPIASFTVLNNDDLSSQLDSCKPNAIVRPIRRYEQRDSALPFRQNVATDEETLWSLQQSHRQKNRFSSSTMSNKMTHLPSGRSNDEEIEKLREELNRKLRSLHLTTAPDVWTKSRQSSNTSQQDHVIKRPLFITTVPTGIFLPPPKEPPIPWFLRPHVYAYSSHPVVLASNDVVTSVASKAKPRDSSIASTTIAADNKAATRPTLNSANPSSNINGNLAATAILNGTRSGQSPPRSRLPLAGGVHLTKQQFQEQLQQRRAKRDTAPQPYRNVMYDRRVIRGSVFGTQQLLENSDPFDKAAELRRRHALRKQKVCRNQRNVLGTPPPVNGRQHEVIQTEKYLEELVQRPPELSVDTQTDLFLEKPPEPPYVPAKVGVDAATEIGEGELFHFDAEAQPIIDILVDACIEQSMLEVAHEREIAALRQKQAEFLAQREAELAELRRLEAEELRLKAEKERRLQQDAIAKELDEEMQKSVTAAKLLQGHIAGLLPEVLDNLEPATDAAKKEHLMKTVAPWLTNEVAEEVGHIVDSREILTAIIQEIIKQRATAYADYKEEMPLETVIERGEDIVEEETKDEARTCESSDISSEQTDKCDDLSKKM